jgi:hypothetical protein
MTRASANARAAMRIPNPRSNRTRTRQAQYVAGASTCVRRCAPRAVRLAKVGQAERMQGCRIGPTIQDQTGRDVGFADEILSARRSQTEEVPMETGSRRRRIVGERWLRLHRG